MASPLSAPAAVHYSSSDGKPTAESDFQRTPLMYAVGRLRHHFRHRPDVYVSGNLRLYYEEGNPRAVVAPDVFVVLGASGADRSSYRLWEEPKAPDFVLEITSRSTHREDQGRKRGLYRSLGVREYWQYDPTGDYPAPPLQGLELHAGEYRRLPERVSDGTLSLASAVLGLELRLTARGCASAICRPARNCRTSKRPKTHGSASGRRGKRRRRASRRRRPPAKPRSPGSPNWKPCCAGHVATTPVSRSAHAGCRRSIRAASS